MSSSTFGAGGGCSLALSTSDVAGDTGGALHLIVGQNGGSDISRGAGIAGRRACGGTGHSSESSGKAADGALGASGFGSALAAGA